jgi:GNAT superfamily N-acetyltransferase
MEAMIIREAITGDINILLLFEQGVIEAERPFDSTLKDGHINYYDIPGMIAAPHIHLLVAELNGELIGSGYARIETSRHFLKHPQHVYLGFMYVVPTHRGKGVNKKIIDSLVQWAVCQGIAEIKLDVYEYNLPAIKAYEKAGLVKHLCNMRMAVG